MYGMLQKFNSIVDDNVTDVTVDENNNSNSLTSVLSTNNSLINLLDDTELEKTTCKKDLGDHKRLRHWSRGHLFVCRPCGHIDFWQPIYRYVT
jgi:hypothetical protein